MSPANEPLDLSSRFNLNVVGTPSGPASNCNTLFSISDAFPIDRSNDDGVKMPGGSPPRPPPPALPGDCPSPASFRPSTNPASCSWAILLNLHSFDYACHELERVASEARKVEETYSSVSKEFTLCMTCDTKCRSAFVIDGFESVGAPTERFSAAERLPPDGLDSTSSSSLVMM